MPEQFRPGLAYLALVMAAGALGWAWHAHQRGSRLGYRLGLTVGCALIITFVGMQMYGYSQLPFAPDTNAYGSIFYMLSWGMDTTALVGLGIAAMAAIRAWRRDDHWQVLQALHAQMAAHYSYFAAVVGIIVYCTLYLSPYLL